MSHIICIDHLLTGYGIEYSLLTLPLEACVCVCVCVREREIEREIETGLERDGSVEC